PWHGNSYAKSLVDCFGAKGTKHLSAELNCEYGKGYAGITLRLRGFGFDHSRDRAFADNGSRSNTGGSAPLWAVRPAHRLRSDRRHHPGLDCSRSVARAPQLFAVLAQARGYCVVVPTNTVVDRPTVRPGKPAASKYRVSPTCCMLSTVESPLAARCHH